MDYDQIRFIAKKLGYNMESLAEKVGVTRQGLQKSIEQNTLRIDVAEKLAIALKLDPAIFIESFLSKSITKTNAVTSDEKLNKILANQAEILKLLQKKSEVGAVP